MTTTHNNGTFDAFISHSGSMEMSELVFSALSRVGPLPWRFRKWWNLRIFFDRRQIRAGDDLPGSISDAVQNSKYFVLLASRAAAQSKWVSKELEFWLKSKPASDILIVVLDGTIEWDQEQNDFNWNVTDCIPAILKGKYKEEVCWEDLRQISPSGRTKANKEKLQSVIASIAAKILDVPRDEIISKERKQRRRLQWIAGFVVAGLIGSTVLAIFLGSAVSSSERRVGPLLERVERIPADEFFREGQKTFSNRRNAGDVKDAISSYDKALELDPRHIPALLAKAYALTVLIGLGGSQNHNVDLEKARDALRRAEEYGAGATSEYHNVKGRLLLYLERDVKGARASLEKAVKLDPDNMGALYSLASTFTFLGQHEEAEKLTENALSLIREKGSATGDKEFVKAKYQFAWTHFYAENYERAMAECDEVLKFDKDYGEANKMLGHISILKGDYKLAVKKYVESGAERSDMDLNLVANYTAALVLDRQIDKARKKLNVLLKGDKYVSPYRFAQYYAVIGDIKNALKQLKLARDKRDPYVVWSAVDPLLSKLRKHPEFPEYLRSVGLGDANVRWAKMHE